ncbi:hypothetical protein ACOMHN_047691 [Nucella lapillus]
MGDVEMPLPTEWTLHYDYKRWSEAELSCELSGGYLANLNTTHRIDVFKRLFPGKQFNLIHVGLRTTRKESTDSYYWLPDCEEVSGAQNESLFTTAGLGDKNDWTQNITNKQFVCERQWGTSCHYDIVRKNLAASTIWNPTSLAPDYVGSETECRERCDERGVNCWAAAYDANTTTCFLHYGTDPFAFDRVWMKPVDAMFVKRCYNSERVFEYILNSWQCSSFENVLNS